MSHKALKYKNLSLDNLRLALFCVFLPAGNTQSSVLTNPRSDMMPHFQLDRFSFVLLVISGQLISQQTRRGRTE